MVSVNIPPEESNPEVLPANIDFSKLGSSEKNVEAPSLQKALPEIGRPLWRLFLLLSLVFFVVELAIANRTSL